MKAHMRLFEDDHRILPTGRFSRKDAWVTDVIDGVEGFLKGLGLERVIWLLCGFAAGYFGRVINVMING